MNEVVLLWGVDFFEQLIPITFVFLLANIAYQN